MTVFTDDIVRDEREGEIKMNDMKPTYDDRYVWMALKAIAVLSPILIGIALAVTPGTGVMLDLWLGFGTANLLVWPVVLVAGLVDSARRAMRTARIVKRSIDRKLELRHEESETTGVEAAAA